KDGNYAGGNVPSGDEENADESQNATAQMASSDASPDVEPEADTQGKVRRRGSAPVVRTPPAATPAPRNFFQRLFGVHPRPAPAPPPPPPTRRRGTTR